MPRIMFHYDVHVIPVLLKTDRTYKVLGEHTKFSSITSAVSFAKSNKVSDDADYDPKCLQWLIEICLENVVLETLGPAEWKSMCKIEEATT